MTSSLFLLVLILFPEELQTRRHKYIIDVESIEQCTEPKYSNVETPITKLKIYKLNRTTRAFNLEFQVKRVWDEDVGISMELDVWAYAGWTRVPYVSLKPDFCNTMRSMFPGIMTDILRRSGARHPDKCPIEPGVISWKNYTWHKALSGSSFPFKGTFRLRTLLVSMETKQLIVCLINILKAEEEVEL